jgi:predicted PurR-regulated permease PerM
MKAATGELNLTVITLLAIAAVIAFFWLMFPQIQKSINSQWNNISTYKGD